jgi:hypothetical protein
MLLHRAAMHKDPPARLRSDAKKNPRPNSSFLILNFQTALVCQESAEATEVARQQMTWKYLGLENYCLSPQNAAVALPRGSWKRFPGGALGLNLGESSLLFEFSESDLVLFAAAVNDVPTWNAGVLQPV